jgi:hypothetical protein
MTRRNHAIRTAGTVWGLRLLWLAPTLLFAVAADPGVPSDGEVRGAIWADIRLNATVGSGNPLVTFAWASGCQPGHSPELRIVDLDCRRYLMGVRCDFDLARKIEGETCSEKDGPVPPLLHCKASLVENGDGSGYWSIRHKPPEKEGGHTRTSMQCTVAGV